MRKAVALAIDRAAVVRSDPDLHATETLLPPGFPGVAAGDYFMPHGDVAEARRLLRGRQLHGVYFTCNRRECILKAAEVIRELERIGIGLKLRTMSDNELFLRTSARGATFDVTDTGWFADYVHADDFLRPLMTSEGIKASQSSNVSYFDQPSIDVQLREAARRGGAAGRQAYETNRAPPSRRRSPLRGTRKRLTHCPRLETHWLSHREPVYGVDLGALCIKHR